MRMHILHSNVLKSHDCVNCPTIQVTLLHFADPWSLHVLDQVHILFEMERKNGGVFTILSSFHIAHISTNMANWQPAMKSCLDEPCAFKALGMQDHSVPQEFTGTAVPVGQNPHEIFAVQTKKCLCCYPNRKPC